jgi:hypothetical protein
MGESWSARYGGRREVEVIGTPFSRSNSFCWCYHNSSFDMMNERLYKTYVNITNIVVRISDGTLEGNLKANAVLVNARI